MSALGQNLVLVWAGESATPNLPGSNTPGLYAVDTAGGRFIASLHKSDAVFRTVLSGCRFVSILATVTWSPGGDCWEIRVQRIGHTHLPILETVYNVWRLC